MYHLLMRKSTSDYALMITFNQALVAALPLGTPEKLANPDFPIPVSFIMGDVDWVRFADEDYGKVCIEANLINKNPDLKYNDRGNYSILPSSGHQLHMDNF